MILAAKGLYKKYQQGNGSELQVLAGIDLQLQPGQKLAIKGSSGSGKSTLLHTLAGLESLDQGQVKVCGQIISGSMQSIYRTKIGFLYQFHYLMPDLNVLENVALPAMIAGVKKSEAKSRSVELLCNLGLERVLLANVSYLSGGERQRVAFARALVHRPKIVFADEPSGQLDSGNANRLFDLILQSGVAWVIATHNPKLCQIVDVVYSLSSGKLTKVENG